jgi:hypothetical protein
MEAQLVAQTAAKSKERRTAFIKNRAQFQKRIDSVAASLLSLVGNPEPETLKNLLLTAAAVCLLGLLTADCVAALSPQSGYSIHWVTEKTDASTTLVDVSGISPTILEALRHVTWSPADWQRVLAVHAQPGDSLAGKGLPAMLGAYSVSSNRLRFEPQFPLAPGVHYAATFQPGALPGSAAGQEALTSSHRAEAQNAGPPTVVTHIYPSASVLPENLLKFYLQFSGPMNRGEIYDHIHLHDAKGKTVELPFLEIDEELWNPDMTRLTLFIDPGRIKRGVQPLEEVGPALENGKSFTLLIDSNWQDARGKSLKAGFEKRFRVGPPDRDPPDPAKWKIEAPASGKRRPLIVKFPEPLDYALALRVIRVADEMGNILAGEILLSDNERRWSFTPPAAWRRGTHHILVPTTIEDLAGNNIGKAFDVDLFDGVERQFTNSSVKIPFLVR